MTFTGSQQISAHKLFDVLQKEYLVCLLRAKVYPSQKINSQTGEVKDLTRYWRRLAEQKKAKITDIKRRFTLLSIFDDQRLLKQYESYIYNDNGLPNFYYADERVKEQQRFWDITNYYSIDSLVQFIDKDFKYNKGVVVELKYDDNIVVVKSEEKLYELTYDCVKRIL